MPPARRAGGPSAAASQILNPLTLVHAYTVGWSATTSSTSIKSSLAARPRWTRLSVYGALNSPPHLAVAPPVPPAPPAPPAPVALDVVVVAEPVGVSSPPVHATNPAIENALQAAQRAAVSPSAVRPRCAPRSIERVDLESSMFGKALVGVLLLFAVGCGEDEGSAGSTHGSDAGPLPCLPAEAPFGADPAKGESFPDLELTACDGTKVTLDALRCDAKVTLLSIGAGWCQPCIEETPELEAAYVELRDEDIGIVQVLVQDAMANPATTLFCTKWVEQFGLTMPVYVDPVGDTLATYENAALPLNVIVERSGKVVSTVVGAKLGDPVGTLRSHAMP
jgi:peroxiredoxin